MDNSLTGQTITLSAVLPSITKSVTINGNGVTLTRSFAGGTSLLYINSAAAEVTIRRVYFKDGQANPGAAIYNTGTLTLESCILSGNQATDTSLFISGGGAVFTDNSSSLTVLGCTFYNNNTASNGGAIDAKGNVTLAGNLFYGNTAASGHNVVYNYSGTVTSLGYNVSDMASGTDGATGSGFDFVTGDDVQVTAPFVSAVSFKPSTGSAVLGRVNVSAYNTANPTLTYPTVDFYGDSIPASAAAAGAVQTTGTGYALGLTTQGNGTVSVAPAPNADGFYTPGSSFTLMANPAGADDSFNWWIVNGIQQSETGDLTVTLNGHTEVRAVFGRAVDYNVSLVGKTVKNAVAFPSNYSGFVIPLGLPAEFAFASYTKLVVKAKIYDAEEVEHTPDYTDWKGQVIVIEDPEGTWSDDNVLASGLYNLGAGTISTAGVAIELTDIPGALVIMNSAVTTAFIEVTEITFVGD
jgi:predicted outer membrane repeat protein